MKPQPFSKALLLVLVVMVITDSVSGDSLSSLLKRRKKITTTTSTTTDRPVEIREEESLSVENKKVEPDLPKSKEVTKVDDVQIRKRPMQEPVSSSKSDEVDDANEKAVLKTVVPVRRKFGKGRRPYRKKESVTVAPKEDEIVIGTTDKPVITEGTTTERRNLSKEKATSSSTERRNLSKEVITPTSTERQSLSKEVAPLSSTETRPVQRKFGKGRVPYRKKGPVVLKENVNVEEVSTTPPLNATFSDQVMEKLNLKKEITTTTTTTEVPVRRKFGKGQKRKNNNEPVVHKKEEVKVEMAERRKKFKRPRPVLNKTAEIKYIPLVDDNGDDIKVAASESVEQEVQGSSVETSSSLEGVPSFEAGVSSSIEGKQQEEGEKEEEVGKLEVKQNQEKVLLSTEAKQKKTAPEGKIVEIKVNETPAPSPEEPENKDRVVTEFMLFRTGVPVDYSYNETADNLGDIVSSAGCPKSIDGYPWVLYKDESSSEPKCYLVGQHSLACHGSAVMNYQRGSEYGVCACNFQECLVKRNMPLNPTLSPELNGNQLKRRNGLPGKLRYRFCRPMGVNCEEFVYDQKEKRCDIMYSQGPCKKNEWLQRNSKGGVECAERLCDNGSGLSEKSEDFQRSFGNVTQDNAECCRPWGGFAVAGVLTRLNNLACEPGQIYSEALKKCLSPFKLSSLIVG